MLCFLFAAFSYKAWAPEWLPLLSHALNLDSWGDIIKCPVDRREMSSGNSDGMLAVGGPAIRDPLRWKSGSLLSVCLKSLLGLTPNGLLNAIPLIFLLRL